MSFQSILPEGKVVTPILGFIDLKKLRFKPLKSQFLFFRLLLKAQMKLR